jgi:precorrin-6B methylase 2
MSAIDESVVETPKMTPFGKVIGIVETREKLQAVSEALTRFDAAEVEVLNGALGVETLEDEKVAVENYFFGDMEAVMVQRYLTAVKSGQIVFAAKVESESVEQAAASIKALGATEIVHFGDWVITNY